MPNLAEYLAEVSILAPQSALNMVVFPLVSTGKAARQYLTLAEAVSVGLAEVREKSLSGTVSEILLENRADRPVLILDGEELVGAKQNRTVNITILAPAGKTTAIPVTCIEAGRWTSGPTEFNVGGRVHYSRGRARKMENVSASLAMCETRTADQSDVWNEIAQKSERMRVKSPTGALSDVFDAHRTRVDDYVSRLRAVSGQIGAIFAIDGKIEGLELFDNPETFSKMLEKLVRSYALDALETAGRPSAVATEADAHAFLKTLADANSQTYPAIGIGHEVRINTETQVAGGLLVEDVLIHLVAFKKQRQNTPGRQSRTEMTRASLRRRYREGR